MTDLMALTLRASVPLGVALLACGVARRRSAALRHLLLAGGIAAALAVAPLLWVAPPIVLTSATPAPASPLLIEVDVPAAPPSTSASAPGFDWYTWALPVWLAGSSARGLWLLVSLVRLRHHTSRGTYPGGAWPRLLPIASADLGVRGPVDVRAIPHIGAPAIWGWRRPTLLIPLEATAWPDARVRMVLLHELAHIRRHDWPVQMLGEVLAIAYWFNPLVFAARRRLRSESEQACDDLVLACGIRAETYGAELAAVARLQFAHHATAAPMAQPSTLERRITAMLNPMLDRRALTRGAITACALAALALAVPAATLHLLAQEAPHTFTVQVFDPSGAVLPGVSIVLGDAREGSRNTTTEGSGRAVFDDVAPGEYTISAAVPGFRTLNGSFTIRTAADRQRSITLQVGELTETVSVSARRPRSAAPSAGAVVEPLRVGGNIKAPRKLTHIAPEYPPAMRDAGLEAVVPIEALIGRDGTVASTRVLSAYVHPEFARAAADAVSRWVFSPTLLNGEAVEVRMNVSVRFSLED